MQEVYVRAVVEKIAKDFRPVDETESTRMLGIGRTIVLPGKLNGTGILQNLSGNGSRRIDFRLLSTTSRPIVKRDI